MGNQGLNLGVGKIPWRNSSNILAWRIPWTEELGGATVHGVVQNQTRLSD